MRDALASTWSAANPRIQFRGWGDCTPSSTGVRILLGTGFRGVSSARLGVIEGVVPNNVQLDVTLTDAVKARVDESLDGCVDSDAQRKACVQAIAVHEFGHVLGFRHEQDRSDVSPMCSLDVTAYTPGTGPVSGPYDADSIMNYCTPGRVRRGPVLSAGDREGARALYPEPGATTSTRPDLGRPALLLDAYPHPTLVAGVEAKVAAWYPVEPTALAGTRHRLQWAWEGETTRHTLVEALGPWQAYQGGALADATFTPEGPGARRVRFFVDDVLVARFETGYDETALPVAPIGLVVGGGESAGEALRVDVVGHGALALTSAPAFKVQALPPPDVLGGNAAVDVPVTTSCARVANGFRCGVRLAAPLPPEVTPSWSVIVLALDGDRFLTTARSAVGLRAALR